MRHDFASVKEIFTPGMTVRGRMVFKRKQSLGVVIGGGKTDYWGCLPLTLLPGQKARDRHSLFRNLEPGDEAFTFTVVGVDIDSKGRPIVILNARSDFDPQKYRAGVFQSQAS